MQQRSQFVDAKFDAKFHNCKYRGSPQTNAVKRGSSLSKVKIWWIIRNNLETVRDNVQVEKLNMGSFICYRKWWPWMTLNHKDVCYLCRWASCIFRHGSCLLNVYRQPAMCSQLLCIKIFEYDKIFSCVTWTDCTTAKTRSTEAAD